MGRRGGLIIGIENSLHGEFEKYLKNIVSDKEDKIYSNYIELSARQVLPITHRLFEEKVSLIYSFEISRFVEKEKNLVIYGDPGSGKTTTLQWLKVIYAGKYLREKEGSIPIYGALDSFTKGSFYDYLKEKAGQEGFRKLGLKNCSWKRLSYS